MLSFGLLTQEEKTRLCMIIPVQYFRTMFRQNHQLLNTLKPGFRVQSLSDEQIVSLILNNLKRPPVEESVVRLTSEIIDFVHTNMQSIMDAGGSRQFALVQALGVSPLSRDVRLYFRLVEEEPSAEYIDLIQEIVLSGSGPQSGSPSGGQADGPDHVPHVEPTEKLRELNGRVDDLSKQLQKEKKTHEERLSDLMRQQDALKLEIEHLEAEKQEARLLLQQSQEEAGLLKQQNEELQALIEKSDVPHKLDEFQGYPYFSLCQVSPDSYGRSNKLIRLNDFSDGEIQDGYLPDIPDYPILWDRDITIPKGTIGVWGWMSMKNYSPQKKYYIKSLLFPKITVTEIVPLTDCHCLEDICKTLTEGIEYSRCSKKTLFVFPDTKMDYTGVLCEEENLIVEGKFLRLSPETHSLRVYSFDKDQVISAADRMFHRKVYQGVPDYHYQLINPIPFIRELFLQRCTRRTLKSLGIMKKEDSKIRSVLENIPDADFYQEIATTCSCSPEEARRYTNEFIQRTERYLDRDDVEDELLREAISHSAPLQDRCAELVRQKWMTEHSEEVRQANSELNQIQKDVALQQAQLQLLGSQYAEKQAEMQVVLNQLASREQLAQDVEAKVAKRIEAARQEAASFIAEMAFVQPAQPAPQPVPQQIPQTRSREQPDVAYHPGAPQPDSPAPAEAKDWQSLLQTLRGNLISAGVSETFAEGFGAFLYAAYRNGTPLLLAGPCGNEICDAFSLALSGKTAAVMDGAFSRADVAQFRNSDDVVVRVADPFRPKRAGLLPELFGQPNRLIAAVQPYSEDLPTVPSGLLSYAQPVLTELFTDHQPGGPLTPGCIAPDAAVYPADAPDSCEIPYLSVLDPKPLPKSLTRKLMTDMNGLLKDGLQGMDVLFALVPRAYAADRSFQFIKEMKYSSGPSLPENVSDILQQFTN